MVVIKGAREVYEDDDDDVNHEQNIKMFCLKKGEKYRDKVKYNGNNEVDLNCPFLLTIHTRRDINTKQEVKWESNQS